MSALRRSTLRLANALGVEQQAHVATRKAEYARVTVLRLSILLAELMGLDAPKARRTLSGLPKYVRDAMAYGRLAGPEGSFALRLRDLYPVLGEHRAAAGCMTGHYFHQDLWAARRIFEAAPAHHVDVGSRIDGFIAHLLTFRSATVIDIRPPSDHVDGLHFIVDDATHLSGIEDASLESVSCLHAVEHFGLGRYGEPVDPFAAQKAMAALSRVLRPGGRLYFAVPVGRERLMFNEHRVFAPSTVLDAFSGLTLVSFAVVDDAGHLKLARDPRDYSKAEYSCGLFEFVKPHRSDESAVLQGTTAT